MGTAPDAYGLSRRYILEEVEASLQRLQINYLDLYQAHRDDAETALEETLAAFDTLVRQGKVRYIGASNYSAARLREAQRVSNQHDYARYECLQPLYHLMNRTAYEGELQTLCLEEGLGVITYSSLASGFLAGKYRQGKALPSSPRATRQTCNAIALASTLHNLHMQTFLPYASFEQTATILDWKRLGKQRLEGMQIIKIITTPGYVGAWTHHPAVKMWRGYENALKLYVNTMITEWKCRGYVNTMLSYDLTGVEILFPEWLGNPRFHDSHKSNLLRKYPEYYSQFHWNVPDDLPYFWPVK